MAPDSVAAVIEAAKTQPLSLISNNPATPSLLTGRRYLADAPTVYEAAKTVLAEKGWKIEEVVAGDPTVAAQRRANGDLGISGTIGVPVPTPRSSVDLADANEPFLRPDSEQYRITAVARDFLFALPSDIDIRIVQDAGETFVDMRSLSRSTGIDLGQNKRFIQGFLNDLDEAMTGKGSTD